MGDKAKMAKRRGFPQTVVPTTRSPTRKEIDSKEKMVYYKGGNPASGTVESMNHDIDEYEPMYYPNKFNVNTGVNSMLVGPSSIDHSNTQRFSPAFSPSGPGVPSPGSFPMGTHHGHPSNLSLGQVQPGQGLHASLARPTGIPPNVASNNVGQNTNTMGRYTQSGMPPVAFPGGIHPMSQMRMPINASNNLSGTNNPVVTQFNPNLPVSSNRPPPNPVTPNTSSNTPTSITNRPNVISANRSTVPISQPVSRTPNTINSQTGNLANTNANINTPNSSNMAEGTGSSHSSNMNLSQSPSTAEFLEMMSSKISNRNNAANKVINQPAPYSTALNMKILEKAPTPSDVPFDLSDFPALRPGLPSDGQKSGSSNNNSNSTQGNNQKGTQEFHIVSEDFPALPGSKSDAITTPSSSSSSSISTPSSNLSSLTPSSSSLSSSLSNQPTPTSTSYSSATTTPSTSSPSSTNSSGPSSLNSSMDQKDQHQQHGSHQFSQQPGAQKQPSSIIAPGSSVQTIPQSSHNNQSVPAHDSLSNPLHHYYSSHYPSKQVQPASSSSSSQAPHPPSPSNAPSNPHNVPPHHGPPTHTNFNVNIPQGSQGNVSGYEYFNHLQRSQQGTNANPNSSSNIPSSGLNNSSGNNSNTITGNNTQNNNNNNSNQKKGFSVPDRFGLLGILSVIRMTDPDLNTLASGVDLTTLGLNLNSAEILYPSFVSPFAEGPSRREPEFLLPHCYYVQPPLLPPRSKLQLLSEETIFYIFYSMPKDPLQADAAAELYNRDWRYHKEHQRWFRRVIGTDPQIKTATYERGSYFYFEYTTWEKIRKDNFVLTYDALEGKREPE